MWSYNAADRSNDYLEHYGVKGMKWGVRRASKQLSNATTKEQASKATASLERHKGKITKQIAKTKNKQTKLEQNLQKRESTYRKKSAKNEAKAAKMKKKLRYRFYLDPMRDPEIVAMRQQKMYKYEVNAKKYADKADAIKNKSPETQKKLTKNQRNIELYNKGLKDVNSALKEHGKDYIRNSKATKRSSRKK